MLALYDKYSAPASLRLELYKACGLGPETYAAPSFEKLVRHRFLLGVHAASQEVIMAELAEECDTQQEMADALGLDDRSNIPHMKKSGKIDGIRFTTALFRFPGLLKKLPPPELAALHGFARATSYLKALGRNDPSIEGTMTPQDFSYLIGVLSEPGWDAAARSTNLLAARELATQIILDKTIRDISQSPHSTESPEQLVKMLQGLRNRWGPFAVLALLIISDDIPADEAHGEVTT
jgi:hypothetical protein